MPKNKGGREIRKPKQPKKPKQPNATADPRDGVASKFGTAATKAK
jgi:hypothetical protein